MTACDLYIENSFTFVRTVGITIHIPQRLHGKVELTKIAVQKRDGQKTKTRKRKHRRAAIENRQYG